MKITILTMGTWGDVMPFIALAKGLKSDGYDIKIVTTTDFKSAIEKQNISYGQIHMSFSELLHSKDCKDAMNGNFAAMIRHQNNFMKKRRENLDEAWEASKDADAIIYHPLFFPAYHIAEKLNIPGIVSTVSPYLTPTKEFPYMFVATSNLGPYLNRLSYILYRLVTNYDYEIVSKWCLETLNVTPPAPYKDYSHRKVNGIDCQIPILYHYSPNMVKTPMDWSEDIFACGYWSLEQGESYQPPESLERFLSSGPAPVYIGFGSIVGSDPQYLTRVIVSALKKGGERGIICTGWGGMTTVEASSDSFYFIESIPHDWIFPRVKALIHHGGAGTTIKGLQFGKPALPCPMTTDHWFWSKTLNKLGVGPGYISQWPWKKLKSDELAKGIKELVTNKSFFKRAKELGEIINKEDGVGEGVKFIRSRVDKWNRWLNAMP